MRRLTSNSFCCGGILGVLLGLTLVMSLVLPYHIGVIEKHKPVDDVYRITAKDFEDRIKKNIELMSNLKQCEVSLSGHMASENTLIKYLHYHKIISDREFFEMTQKSMTR